MTASQVLQYPTTNNGSEITPIELQSHEVLNQTAKTKLNPDISHTNMTHSTPQTGHGRSTALLRHDVSAQNVTEYGINSLRQDNEVISHNGEES